MFYRRCRLNSDTPAVLPPSTSPSTSSSSLILESANPSLIAAFEIPPNFATQDTHRRRERTVISDFRMVPLFRGEGRGEGSVFNTVLDFGSQQSKLCHWCFQQTFDLPVVDFILPYISFSFLPPQFYSSKPRALARIKSFSRDQIS